MLDAHNHHRRNVEPEAGNMAEMVWDDHLEDLAQTWADRCVFEHPKKDPDYRRVGQNLYLTTYDELPTDNVVRSWDNEKINFNLKRLSCDPGKVCGHYTQVVWAATTRVGCGVKQCSSVSTGDYHRFENAWFVVCNYSPRGNFRGVRPYKEGKSCSLCYPGENCRNGLCSTCDLSESDCEEAPRGSIS